MKKVEISVFAVVMMLASALIFTSCNKDEQIYEELNVETSPKINSLNGILIFDSQEQFNAMEDEINEMDNDSRLEWESQLEFESQKSIFEDVARKEYDLQITPYENMTEAEMKDIPFPGHCEEYYQAIEKGVIKEVNEDDGSYIDYTAIDKSFTPFINEQGIIKIGNSLYQITPEFIKHMENGTINDVQELVNSKSETENIEFIYMPTGQNASPRMGRNNWYANADSGWKYSGKRFRAKISVSYTIREMIGYRVIIGYPLTVNTNAQKKNRWGRWNQYWGQQIITGTASNTIRRSASITGSSAHSVPGLKSQFSVSANFYNASNATRKWRPFTGTVAPWNLNYSVLRQQGYYLTAPSTPRFNISAGLPGGCCGIGVSASF